MPSLSFTTTTADSSRRPIRRALISVYDKTGLVELAAALVESGVVLVSTGSTAARIADAGLAVTPVEQVTGFPECLDGRVKTLHPKIHAGILADPAKPDHDDQLAELGVEPFDLVVVNLYPFAQTVASGAAADEVVEQIDIGGPSMIRAAAKNHSRVSVVVDPTRYGEVIAAVQDGGFSLTARRRLAGEAFAHTAAYDVGVASWFQSVYARLDDEPFPRFLGATWDRSEVLRYGENPHQSAAIYTTATPDGATFGLAGAVQLHGKAMSYNNYVDADAAWRAAHDHDAPAVAIIKHANPCGIAVGQSIADAHAKAHACDPLSAYGGVIAANEPLTVAAAEQIAPIFTEVVLAPEFEPGALEILAEKKNIRVLRLASPISAMTEMRQISGGMLIQQVDRADAPGDDPTTWELVAGAEVDERTMADLVFAWTAIRAVKSNAILLAKDGASVGIGMGQVNRVDSCRLAVERAVADSDHRANGAVAASDAYFPFPDGLQVLIDAGVRAVVQPGGSIRDKAVIDAAQAAGVSMFLTGTRHFMH